VGSVCLNPPQAGFLKDTRREVTMSVLKLIVVTLLLLAGVFFLYAGLGTEFRILDHGELEDFGIPIGIAFLVSGMLIKRFWTTA
jgi:hypothetical protein